MATEQQKQEPSSEELHAEDKAENAESSSADKTSEKNDPPKKEVSSKPRPSVKNRKTVKKNTSSKEEKKEEEKSEKEKHSSEEKSSQNNNSSKEASSSQQKRPSVKRQTENSSRLAAQKKLAERKKSESESPDKKSPSVKADENETKSAPPKTHDNDETPESEIKDSKNDAEPKRESDEKTAESLSEQKVKTGETKEKASRKNPRKTKAAHVSSTPKLVSEDDEDAPYDSATIAEKLLGKPGAGPARHNTTYDNKNVFYMNGAALDRPLKMPSAVKKTALIFVAIAAVFGAIVLFFYYDATVNQPAREHEAIMEVVDRAKTTKIDLPNMKMLLALDDAQIMKTLKEDGNTLYEKTSSKSDDEFEVIKLPQDVSVAEAGALYLRGISNLTAAEAVWLLNGSWDLSIDRSAGTNMSVHYADFSASTVEAAIQSAMTAEGLDHLLTTDSGTDVSGNTFSEGNISVGGKDYTWRISSTKLNEVYSLKGMPEDSFYVGIRMSCAE